MNAFVKVSIVFMVLIAGLGACGAIIFVGVNNNLVIQEEGLKAQYKQNQNNYDNYWKKLKEAAQVPDQYASDLKKLYDGTMTGRYGADGSKAMFQMIKEQNPTLDPKMYQSLQEIIEAGRNSFESEQKMLLDKKRIYEIALRTFPNSVVASLLGFPKIDLSKIDIVTSDTTNKAFETKKVDEIKLR